MTSDPRIVWDALARLDYGPHGKLDDFRSRCPAHNGDSHDALHVTTGADGTILMHCFVYGCAPEEIVERIGLRMADLFPSDRAYDARLGRARREDFAGNAKMAADVLLALDRLGLGWRVEVKLPECPCCESQRAALVVDAAGESFTHCQRGCGEHAVPGRLAERLSQQRRGRAG